MRDIHTMRDAGADIPDRLSTFYEMRQRESYNYSHPILKQGKSTFFSGDGIGYVYDHDSIHEAIAYPFEPAYKSYATCGEEVLSSQELFWQQSHGMRIRGVLEETYVLALERSQIPYPSTEPLISFKKALEKVCTSITSGWFREFAWEHYDEVLAHYDENYAVKFKTQVASGFVRAHGS
jgi:hypothetical protein